jgi:hypothetical protein
MVAICLQLRGSMATPSRYASLRSGIVGPKGAATASKSRSTGTVGLGPGGAAAALAEEPGDKRPSPGGGPEAANGVFYGKGAASAKSFRPWYWSYESKTPDGEAAAAAAPAPQPVQTAPREEPVAVTGAPAAVYEPETPAPPLAAQDMRPVPASTKVAYEERTAIADELATTIEHVMSSRYAGGTVAVAAAAPARPAIKAVTAESLMAELSAARQGKSERAPRASEPSLPHAKPAPSLLDRAFVFAGVALVLGALLFMSPWRDQFVSIDRLTHFLN